VIIPYRPNMSSFNFRTASTIDNAESSHSAGKIVKRSNTSGESHIPKWTEPQLLDNWSYPRLGLFCYYHISAFYLVIYRLSKAQLQNELILVIRNQPDRTTKCSLVCASVLFHKSIFQILLILAEWHRMLEFKKICHESIGSSPCLRPAHHIDSKGLRPSIDLRRIPHKMLETPASHKEEPDAWILSVSKPGFHYQNSG
jgi:hypothetical protein